MDYSFYGGRPGQSMVIVKYFSSIEEMNTAFNGGDGYTEVGYGECVLINTDDPRNLENGRLYKRGLQGAEYLGTIKGPAGYPPHIALDDYEIIQNEIKKYKDENDNPLPGMDYLAKDGEFDFIVEGKDNDLVPGYTPSKLNEDGTITAAQYQDTIKWIYASVRDFNEEEKEETTTVKIGFKIPYHVYEQVAYSVSAYTEAFRESNYTEWDFVKDENGEIKTNPLEYINLAQRIDDKKHPFYSKWKFAVPQGVKGDSIKGLKVLTVQEYKEQRNADKEANENIIHHLEWEEEEAFTDADNNRQILVYEYYDYRNSFAGDRITKYLGKYDTISGISVDEYGTLKIDYTYKDPQFFYYLIKWVETVDLNPDNGHFILTYNIPAGDTEDEQKENQGKRKAKYETDLTWVKDVKLTDGVLTFTFTQKDEVENATYSEVLDWIQNISIAQNGEIALTHSYRESEAPNNFKQSILENKLQWVEDIDITPKGDLAVSYNTDAVFETYAGENISLDGYLYAGTEAKSIYELYNDKEYLYRYQLSKMPEVSDFVKENIVYGTFIGQTGVNIENVIFDYTEGAIKTTELLYDLGTGAGLVYFPSSVLIKNNSNILDRNFKWVEKINITEDGEVISNYNYTNDTGQKVSMVQDDKLTWIKGMRLDEQNYQLIAIDNHGQEIKLGSTKVDSTLSVAFNIRPDETLTISETEKIYAGFAISDNLAYLNKKFPKGLDINANGESINEEWMKGKIVTIGPDSLEEIDQRKNFYAFDYNRNQWYYLGTLSGMGALKYQQVAEKEKEENINSAMERLDIGGVCYITTQRPNNAVTTLDFILDLEE